MLSSSTNLKNDSGDKMNEEERYLFDLWGYVVIENVLSVGQLTTLNQLIDLSLIHI